jgi:predicted O-methyltransferase YrrM
MNNTVNLRSPTVIHTIQRDTVAAGFSIASEPQTRSLLRTLASTKPIGGFLELGTGAGLAPWILAGMDPLISVVDCTVAPRAR